MSQLITGIILAIANELKLPVVFARRRRKIEDLLPFDTATFDSFFD